MLSLRRSFLRSAQDSPEKWVHFIMTTTMLSINHSFLLSGPLRASPVPGVMRTNPRPVHPLPEISPPEACSAGAPSTTPIMLTRRRLRTASTQPVHPENGHHYAPIPPRLAFDVPRGNYLLCTPSDFKGGRTTPSPLSFRAPSSATQNNPS